ncbi:MAG TPA: hypothetical protein VG733_15600, partial [Chthoniobacteraceae bacterium]|nr:hypothetical protein [Chthoniobacteraceae bacterium]
HHGARPYFSQAIFFGRNKADISLPEVKALDVPRTSVAGYDGQFYAQVAIHPALTDPDLKLALDMPSYRSRRILMPVMSYVLGFGKPAAVLEAYALLNLFFWYALMIGMARLLKAKTVRDYLCILATVFTTGAIISLQRALTDLPATVLLFYAGALAATGATPALALAVLARETSALYLVRFAWPPPKTMKEWLVLAGRTAAVLAPMVLWVAWVTHVFGKMNEDTHPFVVPFTGWAKYFAGKWYVFTHTPWQYPWSRPMLSWSEALRDPGKEWTRGWEHVRAYLAVVTVQEWNTWELLAPLSLFAQVAYFAVRPAPGSAFWRMGVIFSLMMICMNTSEEEIAYCRAVLPVTLAFNVELIRAHGRLFTLFFIAGNLGLMWGLRAMLASCIFR